MPRVQTYNPAGTVSRQNTGAVYQTAAGATPQAFGESGARALQGMAQGMGDIARAADEIAQRQEAAAMLEADSALQQWENENLHHPEKGYFTATGKQALGGTKQYAEDFDRVASELATKMPARKRQDFEALVQSRRDRLLVGMSRHEANQRKVYFEATEKQAVAGAVQGAINNYTDPEAVAENLNRGELYIRQNLAGDPPAVVQARVEKMKSDAYLGMIDRMAVQDPMRAQKFYAKVKEEIQGVDHAKVERALDGHVTKARAQGEADSIIAAGGTLESQLEKARKIKDADVRDDVVARVKTRFNERETIRRIHEREMSETAWNAAMTEPAFSFEDIPANLPVDDKKALMAYIQKKASGEAVRTDWEVHSQVREMMLENPQAFAGVNLYQFRNRLADSEFEAFLKAQDDLRKGRESSIKAVQSVDSQIRGMLGEIGVKTTEAASKKEKQQYGTTVRRYQEEAQLFMERNGREPNTQERTEILDSIIKTKVSDGWFDDIYAGEVRIDDVPAAFIERQRRADESLSDESIINRYVTSVQYSTVEDIPAGERETIARKLQARGLPASEENILHVFINSKTGF